jgi:hypothetical protein
MKQADTKILFKAGETRERVFDRWSPRIRSMSHMGH